MLKDPNFERDKAFILDMYEDVEFGEFDMKRAIKEHRDFIDLYYDLGCDEDE